MADYPPISRFYVASYAANDRDFPVVAIRLDPRTAGYRVPEDLSPHPDSKRYPNHVFTGAQPASGDQIVTHIYEILPSPYVPFTRYDDDLGPIQGRRRDVKNEGQVARLGPDQRVTYEAREGSAIVYTELEETWSIKTDEDGNSLFPVRDRDFYDASRGAVQERRQLFVPTGEEEGTLENINGVITQTSYEPYNEFLSVKIVQTYRVDGPQLIGKATDNDGQLVTVITQRKGADGYFPPNPTATKTVEVSREDAESLVERIVETPKVFDSKIVSVSKEENIPSKFKAGLLTTNSQEVVAQTQLLTPTLVGDDLEKSEQRLTEFIVKRSATSRPQNYSTIQNRRLEEIWGITIPYSEFISTIIPTGNNIEVEGLGAGKYLVRQYDLAALETKLSAFKVVLPTRINLDLPRVLEDEKIDWEEKKTLSTRDFDSSGTIGSFDNLTQRDTGSLSSTLTLVPKFDVIMKETWGRDLDAETHIFFLKENQINKTQINQKSGATASWPKFAPRSFSATVYGISESKTVAGSISRAIGFSSTGALGYQPTKEAQTDFSQASIPVVLQIPSCITTLKTLSLIKTLTNTNASTTLSYQGGSAGGVVFPALSQPINLSHSVTSTGSVVIPATPPTTSIPSTGKYVVNSSIEPYKFGWYLIRSTVLDATSIG